MDEDRVHYYDRSKSFFDNISCESSERAKGSVTGCSCNRFVVVVVVVASAAAGYSRQKQLVLLYLISKYVHAIGRNHVT